MKEQAKLLKKLLKKSKKILLINHRRMDGDAIWSLIWFYEILKQLWDYQIKLFNEEQTPVFFDFLNISHLFTNNINLEDFSPDLIITFDVASTDQIGKLYFENKNIFLNTTVVNIDHHESNPNFWDINIVDSDTTSACEVVFDLINELWYKKFINNTVAKFLLLWIITDTNSFINTNTSSKAFFTAWELMKYNVNHQELIINLFKRKPYNKLKLWGKILENLKDIKNQQIIWGIVPKSYFVQTETNDKDISGFIDEFLTKVDWLKVGFLIYELPNKKLKASFRSKCDDIDLSNFCEKFWWGWHCKASWFTREKDNINELEQKIITELSKII